MAEEPRISSLAVLARNAESEEEAEEQTQLGTELALIIDQQHAATCTNDLPDSQEAIAENDAAEIVATRQKLVAVRIQSYMDAAYGAFRSAAGGIPENEVFCVSERAGPATIIIRSYESIKMRWPISTQSQKF